MPRLLLISIATMSLVCLTACSASPASSDGQSSLSGVHGSVTVPRFVGSSGLKPIAGDPCTAKAGYDDIAAGTQVTVKDASGKTLAFTSLDAGTVSKKDPLNTGMYVYCEFPFTIDKLPASAIYAVSAGGVQRGAVNFEKADVSSHGFDISIG